MRRPASGTAWWTSSLWDWRATAPIGAVQGHVRMNAFQLLWWLMWKSLLWLKSGIVSSHQAGDSWAAFESQAKHLRHGNLHLRAHAILVFRAKGAKTERLLEGRWSLPPSPFPNRFDSSLPSLSWEDTEALAGSGPCLGTYSWCQGQGSIVGL